MYFFLLPTPILRSLSAPCVSPLIRPSLPQAKKKKKNPLSKKRIKALKVGLPALSPSPRPGMERPLRKAGTGVGGVDGDCRSWGRSSVGKNPCSAPSLQPI